MKEEIKVAIKKGDFDEAKRLAQEIGDEEERERTLGFIALKAGDYAEAEQRYRPFAEAEEPSFPVLYNYGMALFNQGKLDAAIEALERAYSMNPQASNVLLTLGLAYRGRGDLEKARECFEKGGFHDLAAEIPKEVPPPPKVSSGEPAKTVPVDLPTCEPAAPIRIEMEGMVKIDPSLFVAFWGEERKRVEAIGGTLWIEGKGTLVIMPQVDEREPQIDIGEGAGQLAVLLNGKTLYLATQKESKVAYNTVCAQWSPENI